MQPLYSGQEAPMGGAAQCGSVWSHIGHIPDLLAQVLLPLLTSGESVEEQLEVMGARRWAGHSLAAPDSLGQKVEQAHHL